MPNFKLIFDENTFGITQASLKMLRNELAKRCEHRIDIVQVQTDDICCGYLILDLTTNEAVFTGDGFRTDGGGEGGAGFRTAYILIHTIYRLVPFQEELKILDPLNPGPSFEKFISEYTIGSIAKPSDNNPGYVR